MTYLYLSYPAIPFDALVRTQNITFSEDRPIGNIIYGERYQYASGTAAASGVVYSDWDLGSGNSQSVDHVIIANAYKLIQQGTTNAELYSSTDAASYSSVWQDASFNSATLYGPDSYDYLASGLSLTAKRAWRSYFSGGSASTREICKVYFGTAWDAGKNPDTYELSRIPAEGGRVKTEDGGDKFLRLGDPRYRFSCTWKGVSDSAARTFYTRVKARWQQHKFFLFTTGNHRILNNMRVLHVRLLDEPVVSRGRQQQSGLWVGYNTITCNFQECKG